MTSGTMPKYFFLNGKLHKYIRTVMSDNSIVAWCYQDEQRLWLPRVHTRKMYKKAYTITQAAKLINVSAARIKEIIDKGLVSRPERAYDIGKSTFKPLSYYINEDDMVSLRQAAWDVLPKNRFGEPKDDTMVNEDELLHRMQLGDDREFRRGEDGGFERVYKA